MDAVAVRAPAQHLDVGEHPHVRVAAAAAHRRRHLQHDVMVWKVNKRDARDARVGHPPQRDSLWRGVAVLGTGLARHGVGLLHHLLAGHHPMPLESDVVPAPARGVEPKVQDRRRVQVDPDVRRQVVDRPARGVGREPVLAGRKEQRRVWRPAEVKRREGGREERERERVRERERPPVKPGMSSCCTHQSAPGWVWAPNRAQHANGLHAGACGALI